MAATPLPVSSADNCTVLVTPMAATSDCVSGGVESKTISSVSSIMPSEGTRYWTSTDFVPSPSATTYGTEAV